MRNIINANERRRQEDLERGEKRPESYYNIAEEVANNNADLINDVGAEAFIAKNIRVRPISGTTNAEREEQARQEMLKQGGMLTDAI